MAAIAPITIADGQDTPVNHTFNPISANPPLYKQNTDDTVAAIGENELLLTLKRGVASQGNPAINRAKITLRLPVLETLGSSGASGYEAPPSVAYWLQATVECMLPDRSTGEQRKDLRVLLTNALSNAQIVSLVDTLENPY